MSLLIECVHLCRAQGLAEVNTYRFLGGQDSNAVGNQMNAARF